jgi:hypothetical protein
MKKTVHFFIVLLSLFLIFISMMMSPYKYEWSPETKQINDDSTLVLRILYFFLMILNIAGYLYATKEDQKIRYFYFCMMLLFCYKLIATFYL